VISALALEAQISLDLDEQRSADEEGFDRVTMRSLTRTSLYHPHCMMHAMPTASLRSLLLICILRAAFAWSHGSGLRREQRRHVPGIDADDGQPHLMQFGP
jgi:hypothetical protein